MDRNRCSELATTQEYANPYVDDCYCEDAGEDNTFAEGERSNDHLCKCSFISVLKRPWISGREVMSNHAYTMMFVLMCIFVYVPLTTSSPINVSLGFLTPLDESLGPLSTLGKELQSAFKLAVKAVNENRNKDGRVYIREDFAAAVRDETTQPNKACMAAAESFHKDTEYVGIVGAYSSECSIAVQKQLKNLKSYLSQISYRSPSMELSKQEHYAGFYRMTSNNKQQSQVIIDLIKHFRWSQVGLLHTSDFYYGRELSDEIVSKLTSQYNIRISDRRSIKVGATDVAIDEALDMIKNSGSQINIIVAQGNDVFNLLRRIKYMNMYGKGWVWILTDGATCLDFSHDGDVNMTASGMIGVAPEMFKGKAYVDNIIVKWFHEEEDEYPGKIWNPNEQMPSISPFVGQVYLAVSTYYNLLTELVENGTLTQGMDVAKIRSMLRGKLQSMNSAQRATSSILGNKVYFADGTDGPPTFTITNYVGELFKTVGSWDGTGTESERLRLDLKNAIIWPGGSLRPPKFKGKPGKLAMRVAFVAPTNAQLGTLSDIGTELVSAFNVAVDMINEDKGYQVEIEPVIFDEGLDGSNSCYRVAERMKKQKLVAVVGSYRSECSMKLHQVLGTETEKMPIISYASLSKQLSNKDLYKYFFRVVPSNIAEAEILTELIIKYRFKEVSILYSDEVASKETALHFVQSMRNNSVPITLTEEFSQNSNADTLRKHLLQIRQSGSRVVLVSALPNDARLITQLIKELEMAGKGWIWFGSTGTTTQHFRQSSNIGRLLNGMIGVNPKDGEGPKYTRFRSVWKSKDSVNYPGIIHSSKLAKTRPFTAQVYDAVRAVALSLTDLAQKKLVTFKTSKIATRALLYKRLREWNNPANGFLSATGPKSTMFFDKNQDAPLVFDIVNLVDNEWKTFGRFPKKRDGIDFIKQPLFPGGYNKPVVNPGKIIYKVAAFFPMSYRLNSLSELGLKWKTGLKAAINWLAKNDSLTVGFEAFTFDTGMFHSANCSKLAENLPYVDIVIGAARSECTASLYRALESKGVPIITYSSTSALLSQKTRYPNLFRVCSSDNHQAVALSDLVEKYTWEKVGMIGSKGIYGEELTNEMENELNNRDVKVTRRELFKEGDGDMLAQMKKLRNAGSGVNMIVANPSDSMQLFQNAFEINMVGKGWTWIGSDGATSTSFKVKQNLLAAMQGMVGIRPTVGSGPLFEAIFKELLQIDGNADKKTAYLAQVFDSVLLPAFALHSMHMKRHGSTVLGKIPSQEFLQYLRSMRSRRNGFQSTVGKQQYFDLNQDVVPYYDLVNLNGDWIKVGSYENGQLDITRGVVWPGGTIKVPPADQPRYEAERFAEGESEGGTSVGLIVLAVVFGGFSILVIVFMIYIVRRVRYRHLYMQSDINHGGVFSVLYGHTVNRPSIPLQNQCTLPLQTNTSSKLDSMDSGTGPEILDPMLCDKLREPVVDV